MDTRILKIRCRREETLELWRTLLKIYRREGRLAEDLLLDALRGVAARRLKPEVY